MLTRRLLPLVVLVLTAACAVEQQGAPALSGPSELGLSLAITASPDVLTQDGQSQSVIEVTARDANSQPMSGLTLRAETSVGGQVADFGTLSSKTISTNNAGKATVLYQAPQAVPTATSDSIVEVNITPVGGDYANALTRLVKIRLTRPFVIQPPSGAPKPSFYFSPTQPKENEDIFFDGSASTDDGQIVSYEWSFGDGRTGTGMTVRHHYDLAGTYNVTLTVTDDRGQKVTSAPQQVSVGSNAGPSAVFTFSPGSPTTATAVNFNASGSTAASGRSIADYDWDFGDGTPHTKGVTTQHTFATAGTYNVTLVVTDDTSRVATASKAITIGVPTP